MTSDEMARAARAVLDESFDITFSAGGGLIELAAHGITKATGLAEVAERFDVPVERVIAFGDMPNDLDMLRWAGHGVAMANAHPAVREVADEITGPNGEDGVAQVLERWF
jgi:HAD superfamily hydrolase (TIGR01484 family)